MSGPNASDFHPVDTFSDGRPCFGSLPWTRENAVESDRPLRHSVREVDPRCQQDVHELTRLHMLLLGHGPMAQLGEFFLRRFCYTVLIKEGLMRAALFEVEGRSAGFVAYTPWSITFHRRAIAKHWLYVGFLVAVSFLRDPRLLRRLVKAMKLMVSRRSEVALGRDPQGEIVAIGVLSEFRSPRFLRETGLRISEALVAYAVSYFRRAGIGEMRMIVEATNKPTLFLYHSLGARFEPYEQMGEPMIHVRFDLDRHFDTPARNIPKCWTAQNTGPNDNTGNEWQEYWDGLENLPEIFRVEAADFVKRLESVVRIGPGTRVLDFGCGFGYVADSLAAKVAEVSLWDFSWNMRRQARLLTAQHQNIVFLDFSGPAAHSELSFDLIVVNSVSQYMTAEEFSRWLGCWQRLLRPNGRLVLSDLIPSGPRPASECVDFLLFSARNGFLMRALSKGLAELRRYPKANLSLLLHSVSHEDLLEKATAAGLRVEFLPSNLTHRRGRTAAVLTKAAVDWQTGVAFRVSAAAEVPG